MRISPCQKGHLASLGRGIPIWCWLVRSVVDVLPPGREYDKNPVHADVV